jgi:hypothetical protein
MGDAMVSANRIVDCRFWSCGLESCWLGRLGTFRLASLRRDPSTPLRAGSRGARRHMVGGAAVLFFALDAIFDTPHELQS